MASSSHIAHSTSAYGFDIHTTRAITRADFIAICEQLCDRLSASSGVEVVIRPEPISEGGLFFASYEDIHGPYKSMRFSSRDIRPSWPWINSETVMTLWKEDQSIVFPSNAKIGTFLKAFKGAPQWTLEELRIIEDVFIDFGMICKKFPKKSELIYKP
jgi:hypothetical protein